MADVAMSDSKKSKFNIKGLIFRSVLILIAGLTVGFGFFSLNSSKLLGDALPMPFGIGASVVLSGSMEPTLSVNDLVFVKAEESYDKDDVVVYQSGQILVIHRIIEVADDHVITQGDANNTADAPVSLDQIKGKMLFSIPFIGVVVKFLKSLPGILIVLALVIFMLFKSRQKEKDEGDKELDKIKEEIRKLKAYQENQPPNN